ncbi:MAG: hypothetical protein V9G12_25115 [Microthrixaceae bacterium]
MFADLSGFTPLSERFAKRGQVGAELLTDLLNELFAPILDHALSHVAATSSSSVATH